VTAATNRIEEAMARAAEAEVKRLEREAERAERAQSWHDAHAVEIEQRRLEKAAEREARREANIAANAAERAKITERANEFDQGIADNLEIPLAELRAWRDQRHREQRLVPPLAEQLAALTPGISAPRATSLSRVWSPASRRKDKVWLEIEENGYARASRDTLARIAEVPRLAELFDGIHVVPVGNVPLYDIWP
jgi:hypothetical protein